MSNSKREVKPLSELLAVDNCWGRLGLGPQHRLLWLCLFYRFNYDRWQRRELEIAMGDLLEFTGINSSSALVRRRNDLVDAGLLQVIPGTRSIPAKYRLVLIASDNLWYNSDTPDPPKATVTKAEPPSPAPETASPKPAYTPPAPKKTSSPPAAKADAPKRKRGELPVYETVIKDGMIWTPNVVVPLSYTKRTAEQRKNMTSEELFGVDEQGMIKLPPSRQRMEYLADLERRRQAGEEPSYSRKRK